MNTLMTRIKFNNKDQKKKQAKKPFMKVNHCLNYNYTSQIYSFLPIYFNFTDEMNAWTISYC